MLGDGKGGMPMQALLERLEVALGRAESAALEIARVASRHEALRSEVAAVLAELDALILAEEEGRG